MVTKKAREGYVSQDLLTPSLNLINDIKKATGCESDDAVEILESVERLTKVREDIIAEIGKFSTSSTGDENFDIAMDCVGGILMTRAQWEGLKKKSGVKQ